MAKIKVNNQCNVRTGEDSTHSRGESQITIPSLRACLSLSECATLLASLREAVDVVEGGTIESERQKRLANILANHKPTPHTPAPWVVKQEREGRMSCMIRHAGLDVAVSFGETPEEAQANGAMIAASPDLHDALRNLLEWCAGGDMPQELYAAGQKALAKSEGLLQ